MREIHRSSVGETWLAALGDIYRSGADVAGEIRELVGMSLRFDRAEGRDPVLVRFASHAQIEQVRAVFCSRGPNRLGHSYADRLFGPLGRRDLSDVSELLSADPWSKRAVVTIAGTGDGKVPCINALHFLRREAGLLVIYFARGQDIFQKFYADGLCVFEMAATVAERLRVPVAEVRGLVSSAHIYLTDLPAIERLLAQATERCPDGGMLEGGPA
jgi:hypothetical protein